MDITTQVVNVTTRTTQNGKVVYDVATADGQTRSTWDGRTAQQLQSYVLQGPVQLRIRQRPSRDGSRVWEDITAFAPMGQSLPPEQPQQQGFAGQPYQQQGFAGVPQNQAAPFTGFQQTEPKEHMPESSLARITKMGCLGYAADLVGSLMQGAGPEAITEATSLCLRVAEIFYKRARSHENVPVGDQQGRIYAPGHPDPAQALSGAQIASGIPGVQLGAPVQVDVDEGPDDDPVTGSDSGWD